MNAGAFGGEVGDAIIAMTGVSSLGEVIEHGRENLEFSYRKLALGGGVMVTSVRFRLLRSPAGSLRTVVEKIKAKRRRKQPFGLHNAGSVFKNPAGENAGRLIELAGLKGRVVGDAEVSTEHANFIVNRGAARARDVCDLMSIVQQEVWRRSGVWLEPELRLIGDWG